MIRVKRVYEAAESADGFRFLVDRMWPRGVSKASLALEAWLKDVAPSSELRNWYHHNLSFWDEFCRRYFAELRQNPDSWKPLLQAARRGTITLLYSSTQIENNNAVALKYFLSEELRAKGKT